MSNRNKILILAAMCVLLIAGVLALIKQDTPGPIDGPGPAVKATPVPTSAPTPAGVPMAFPKMPDWLLEAPAPTPEVVDENKEKLPPLSAAELKALRDDIYGDDKEKRSKAFDALAGYLTQSRGIPLLNELVLSNDEEIQYDVISVLPNLPDEDRLPVLELALDNETAEFRAEIMAASRDFVGLDMNKFLTKAMNETDEDTLAEATTLYFYFSDHDIYEAAFEGVRHSNPEVREAAMDVFETKHTAKSILLLIEILKSPYPDMVARAGDTLRLITDAWDIESNGHSEWVQWANAHGKEWVRKYEPEALKGD